MTSRVGVQFDGTAVGALNASKQASAGIRSVRTEAAASGPSLRGMETNLGRVERGALAGAGALHGMGRAALYLGSTYIGAFGVGALLKSATDTLVDQVRVGAQLGAVLRSTSGIAGETAGSINRIAKAEMAKTGVDSTQIKSAEVMLLRYSNVRDVVGEGNDIFGRATHSALDLAAALGGTAADQAATLGKALQDPYKGVTLLRRANVALTASEIDHIKTLAQHGKVLEAQKAILDAVTRSYGGTAKAVGDASPWTKLSNTLKAISASAIRPLLPEMDSIVKRGQRWADGVEHNAAMHARLKRDIEGVVGDVKTFVHVADDVAGTLGGWKRAIEIVLALKFAGMIRGWSLALDGALVKLAAVGPTAVASFATADAAMATTSVVTWETAAGGALLAVKGIGPAATASAAEATTAFGALAGKLGRLASLAAAIFVVGNSGESTANQPPGTVAYQGGWVDPNTGTWVVLGPGGIRYDTGVPAKGFKMSGGGTAVQPGQGAIPGKGVAIPTVISPTHDTRGLKGFPAVDIMAKPGTRITAPENGMITRISGSEPTAPPSQGQGGPWGLSIYFVGTETGNTYYLTHLMKVAPVGGYKRGDTIGLIGDYPGSKSDHVHVGVHQGDAAEAHVGSGLFKPSDFLKPGSGGAAPPPPGSGTGPPANIIPSKIRQAIAAANVAVATAALTPGKADDKAAIQESKQALEAEIAWIRAKLATNVGAEKRITLEDLLTGALGDLAGLTADGKKKAGASISTITSLRASVNATLRDLPSTLDDVERQAVSKLTSLRDHLKVGMKAKDLADTRASIKRWGVVLSDEISKQAKIAADAAQSAAAAWQRGWQNDVNRVLRDFQENVINRQLDAFDRETAAHLQGLQEQYGAKTLEEQAVASFDAANAAADEAKQRADIAQQIIDTQAQLAALGTGSSGTLIDIATGQRTPITGTDLVQQRKTLLDQLQNLNDQNAQLDRQDQRAALQAAADLSRTAADRKLADAQAAYQDDRAAQRQALSDQLSDQQVALQQSLDDWQANIEAKKQSWSEFLQWLKNHGYSTVGIFDPSPQTAPPGVLGAAAAAAIAGRLPGQMQGFALGGPVPGTYIGRDSVPILAEPGERVLTRQVNALLERAAAGGGNGSMVTIVELNGREIVRQTSEPMTSEQARRIGYTLQRG